MSDLPVLYESDGRVARITLNRPEVLNAIDDTLPVALESAVKRANSDQRVRAIILAGSAGLFARDMTSITTHNRLELIPEFRKCHGIQ